MRWREALAHSPPPPDAVLTATVTQAGWFLWLLLALCVVTCLLWARRIREIRQI